MMTTDERRARAMKNATNAETPEGLQYVLVRGFSAMGYDLPISAAEEMLDATARAIRESDEAAGMVLVSRALIEQAACDCRTCAAAGFEHSSVPGCIYAKLRAIIAATEAE